MGSSRYADSNTSRYRTTTSIHCHRPGIRAFQALASHRLSGSHYSCVSILYCSLNMPVSVSLFGNYRSQFLLNRLGRYRKLFESTAIPSSHEFASQFGLAKLLQAKKNPQNERIIRVTARVFSLSSETRRKATS